MKKFAVGIVALVLTLVLLVGCVPQARGNGGSQSVVQGSEPTQSIVAAPTESSSVASVAAPEPSEEMQEVAAGEMIVTETREITINHVEFSYDVLPTERYMLYTHYTPDSGKVYIDVAVTVKNLQKQALDCDDVMTAEADYNDGYTYNGFAAVEDSMTGFTYANISNIDPLESVNMRYLIECPQEVEDNMEAPLFLVLSVEGVRYKLIIR